MKLTDRPTNVPIPWANGAGLGYINPIPVVSQIGTADGYASWPDGFPPLTFQDPSTGGFPPRGQDMNGVLNAISAGLRWVQAGGFPAYDSAFATSVGGYPAGSLLASKTYTGLIWRSLTDDNLTDPDAFGSTWAPYNRLRLSSDQTIWVDQATGNDDNSGLAEGQALLTIGRALNVATSFVDPSGWQLTIEIKAGAYTNDPIFLNSGVINGVVFSATHGTVTLSMTNASILAAVYATSGASLTLSGNDFVLGCTSGQSSSSAIIASSGGLVSIVGNLTFHSSTNANMLATTGGRVLYALGSVNDQITQDTPRHWWVGAGGQIDANGSDVTLVGTRNFSTAFVDVSDGGNVHAPNFTATGTATGKRWNVQMNGTISGVSGDPNVYFPGSVAGTQATGGQIG